MKINELNNLIENTIYNEVKKLISEEVDNNFVKYHIKMDNEPIASYDTEEEAKEELPKYKKSHPDKELIIEKSVYESYDDMIDQMDEMNEKLENKNMKKFKSIAEATLHAKKNGIKQFKANGKTYNVNETWDLLMEEETCDECGQMEEEESECMECGDNYIKETSDGHGYGPDYDALPDDIQEDDDYLDSAYEDRTHLDDEDFNSDLDRDMEFDDEEEDEEENDDLIDFKIPEWAASYLINGDASALEDDEIEKVDQFTQHVANLYGNANFMLPSNEEDMDLGFCPTNDIDSMGSDCVKLVIRPDNTDTDLDEEFDEMGDDSEEEKDVFVNPDYGVDDDSTEPSTEVDEMMQTCSECGGTMMEGECMECGMKNLSESRKTKIKLKESEFVALIKKIIKESVPGLEVTKRDSQNKSKQENDEYIASVNKKIKDYLSFEGNDNPEFPKQIGKGEKMAFNNTKEQDEEVAKNFAGLQNLDYDIEPSDKFKERLKMAIEGDTLMGNGPTTEKPSIKPSNGADKGKEAKEKSGTSIPTPETAKKLEKQMKDRGEDKKNRVLYTKERVPVKTGVNESKMKISEILNEEITKMMKLSSYNKKTQ